MFNLKILITIAAFLFYFDCYPVKNANSTFGNSPNVKSEKSQNQTDEIPGDLLITLERTACYGRCPIYKLTIKADGSVLFDGERFTKTIGKAEGKISEDKVKKLIKEFENADYFALDGEYDCYQMTDNPSAFTSIQINGKNKKIKHYQGCESGSDEFEKELSNLTELENKIDEIIGTQKWIK